MEPRQLTDVPFDRIADANDLHLLQALQYTRQSIDAEQARGSEPAGRLHAAVAGLLDELATESDDVGNAEDLGDRTERLYDLDPDLIDRARAALMAYDERGDGATATAAAEAVEQLRAQR